MDFELIVRSMPLLLKGAVITIELTLISMTIGLIAGTFTALARLSRLGPINWLARQYVTFVRGTPLLVQLFLIYYGMPQLGITLDAFTSAVIGLSFNNAAYLAEIIRAGIQAVNKGQMEAALSLGMSYPLAIRRIILPQAFKIIIPPLGNNFIILLKDTSLVATITVVELLRAGQRIISVTYKPIEIFLSVAAIYLALTTIFSRLLGTLEERMSVSD